MFSWRRSWTLPFRPIKSRLASWPPTTVTPGARPTTTLSRVSPQEKIIVELIKMTRSKVYIRLILNTMLLPEWSTAVFYCLVIVVHESLVCPGQLNCLLFFRKILQVPHILWFSCISVYLNPFKQWLYDFEIHLFTPRTTERLIYNYYRRFKHSLMLQKKKSCIKGNFLNLKIRVNLT